MDRVKAIQKIRSVADHVQVAMMTTLNANLNRLRSRPLQVARVDDDAAMWFFTDEYTGKMETLQSDNPVSLTFSSPEKRIYLSLMGHTYLVNDEQLENLLWTPVLNSWYYGKNKEDLQMIKFMPESAEYWEEEDKVWKRIFYAGKAMVTGDSYKKGQHEKMSL